MFSVRPGMAPFFLRTSLLTIPEYLTIDLGNAHPLQPQRVLG